MKDDSSPGQNAIENGSAGKIVVIADYSNVAECREYFGSLAFVDASLLWPLQWGRAGS